MFEYHTGLTAEKAKMVSVLSQLPTLDKSKRICYWSGVGMSQEEGLIIASSIKFKIHPTPEMKKAAYKTFLSCYNEELFGDTSSWNFDPDKVSCAMHYSSLCYFLNYYGVNKRALKEMTVKDFFYMFGVGNE